MSLKVDYCSHEAAKYACKKWHYSGCLPTGKLFKTGVWEQGSFKGVIIYSRGAAQNIGEPYNLDQTEICELTRIALSNHQNHVSQMIKYSLKLLKKKCGGVKLVVSYADSAENHHGGIYQASNWVYVGSKSYNYIKINGELKHPKSLYSKYGTQSVEWLKKHVDKSAKWEKRPPKYKYLMPLDEETKKRIQSLAKPYPSKEDARNADVD